MSDCGFCNPTSSLLLVEGRERLLLAPERLHVAAFDGGHVLVVPRRHLATRAELLPDEVLEMWRLSLVGARALSTLLSAEWFNYQENGNWTVDEPRHRHLHLHVYGRRRDSTLQPFGEALRFPLKRDLAASPSVSYSTEQLGFLREYSLRAAREALQSMASEEPGARG
ncbi:HIT domain-containing protein [bacterium]|nr:MAG: HIT domain-containing protein [bacterium]